LQLGCSRSIEHWAAACPGSPMADTGWHDAWLWPEAAAQCSTGQCGAAHMSQ
jgi:hypothetical protein